MNYKEILKQQTITSSSRKVNETRAFVLENEHGHALELDIKLRTGDRWGLPYAYKTAIEFNLSGDLTIHFTTHTINIKGRNLSPLYDALVAHRVAQILEHDNEFDDLPEQATVINSITIVAA